MSDWKEEGYGPCHTCDKKRPVNGFDICEPCTLDKQLKAAQEQVKVLREALQSIDSWADHSVLKYERYGAVVIAVNALKKADEIEKGVEL